MTRRPPPVPDPRAAAEPIPSAPRALLEAAFRHALTVVDPAALVAEALGSAALAEADRVWLLAAGKAAAPMARALEERVGGRLVRGLAVTKEGHGLALECVELREAGHPIPDARSEQAGREALALAERVPSSDRLVVLLSGGASALLATPLEGLTQADVAATVESLLRAGVRIDALNTVRKHLLAVSGGRLATRCRAHRIDLLALSDVPGDRLDVLASGPCSADPTTYADALEVLRRLGLVSQVPTAVCAHLEAGARGEREETPKPGNPELCRVHARVLASNRTALEGVVAWAARHGLRAWIATDALGGEAREAGRRLAGLARALAVPGLLVAGGETTVTVRGRGRGGRNQELALGAALALQGCEGVTLLAAGTDGGDGPTDAAGAYADGGTVARGRVLGVEAARALAENDSHGFFCLEGGVFRTGPTRTNVMDLVLALASNPPFPPASKSV